jgi:hypothetical protein
MQIIKDFGKPEWKDLLEQSFPYYFKYCISNFKFSQLELFLFSQLSSSGGKQRQCKPWKPL